MAFDLLSRSRSTQQPSKFYCLYLCIVLTGRRDPVYPNEGLAQPGVHKYRAHFANYHGSHYISVWPLGCIPSIEPHRSLQRKALFVASSSNPTMPTTLRLPQQCQSLAPFLQLYAKYRSFHVCESRRALGTDPEFSSNPPPKLPFPTKLNPSPHEIFHLHRGATQTQIKKRCEFTL